MNAQNLLVNIDIGSNRRIRGIFVHRDIQVIVVFIIMRVKNPDENEWIKTKIVLKHVKGKGGIKLTLCI